MKTLDEVIDALEICSQIDAECDKCPYKPTAKGWCEEKDRDALHYLKEYRETKKHLACLNDAEIRGDNTQVVNNPPLTWDELKKMSGKPVWVEWIDGPWKGNSKWVLIERVAELMAIFTAIDACGVNYNGNLHNLSMGTQWKAYRKEQK